MDITNCRVNHIVAPMGYLMEKAVFSWTVENAIGKEQVSARIIVKAGSREVIDTGWSVLSSLGTQLSLPLEPRTRYRWRVSVRSDAGEEAESSENIFETGKLNEPWSAKWITAPAETVESQIFKKSFHLSGRPVSARLYICGLGLYEASINGRKVGQERLTPYCTDYRAWVQYQTYDVTELLSSENELAVELADGWYKGRFSFEKKGDCIYGKTRKLIAELRATIADGSEAVIISDESWLVTKSHITFSGIYDGEHRDDTLAADEGSSAVLLSEKPPQLSERLSIPVVAHEELRPIALIKAPNGEQIFDLGQNFAGVFRLRVHEPWGRQIRLQFGEVLQDGCFYRDNLRTAKAEYIYVSDGREHILEPKFTYYGYRYAKVEGVSPLKITDFTGIALYSDVAPVGRLVTGDEKINRLIENIRWGQKSNFIDVPTDCPQRDERMGWTADTQVFVPTAAYFTDSAAFYRKYLKDLRSEQSFLGGAVPFVVPSFKIKGSCSVWGDAATIIPWTLYIMYGDISILSESLDSMAAWVDYITEADGEDHGWRSRFHFGDWLALDHPALREDTVQGGTDEAFIADVYYMHSAELTAKAARVLGKKSAEEKYAALAAKLRSGIISEYFTETGRCTEKTQTGLTLSLLHKLTSDRERTTAELIRLIGFKGNKLVTGFVGTPLIFGVLSEAGSSALAYEILHDEDYPGWLYEINLGATTVWERWNSLDENGRVSSTGMNSFNHYAYGAVGQWLWETAAGIRPTEAAPGFKSVIIHPVADWGLGWVKAEYRSPAGTYRVEWKIIDEAHVSLRVEIPFDCKARLVLAEAREPETIELAAGAYSTTYEAKSPLRIKFTVGSTVQELLGNIRVRKRLLKRFPGIEKLPKRLMDKPLAEALAEKPQPGCLLPEIESLLSEL